MGGVVEMVTKNELFNQLVHLQAENHQLKQENEYFKGLLNQFYGKLRIALGIEDAAQARENQKEKS